MNRWSGQRVPSLTVLVCCAAVGVLCVGLVHRLGADYGVWVTWAALFACFVAFGIILLRFSGNGSSHSEKLIQILNSILEGKTSGEKLQTQIRSLDPQLRDTVSVIYDTYVSLQQYQQRGQMVFANVADGMLMVSSDGIIVAFNRSASRIFNRSEDEVVGRKIEEVDLHPEVARVAYESTAFSTELSSEIKLPGLPFRVINIHSTPYCSVGDSSGFVMIILHDLTELRRHENNQKEFVSNVSHELRTPITSIRTTAEVLLGGAKNDEEVVDRFLSTIITESDRLSSLISDLMEIAKRDAGVIKTDKINVRVTDIIQRAVDVLHPQAEQRDITISVSVNDDLIAYCDEMQMVQVVRNLADNAVKYTPSGGSVAISAHRDGDEVVISVKDTGIGIPHGEIDRIFERFYRVDKARSRRLGGTGLGLAIVKDILDAHNGEILVDSRLGKGSEFVIKLPG